MATKIVFAPPISKTIVDIGRGMVPPGYEMEVLDPAAPEFAKAMREAEYLVGFPRPGMGAEFYKNAPKLKRTILYFWFVLVPLVTRMFGYFPGRKLRKVGDLPRGVILQWRRWCLNPRYSVGAEGELAAEVDEREVGTDRMRRDDDALDHLVRVALDEHAVLERRRLAFVTVDDEIPRVHAFRQERPLLAGREVGAAPAAQARNRDLLLDVLGRGALQHVPQDFVATGLERGIDGPRVVRAFVQPLAGVDRAVLDGETDGFVKVLVPPRGDRILGATVVSAQAGELISELSVAMAAGFGLGRLSAVIHPYPTRAEAVRKLGDAYQATRLTPLVKGLLAWWLRRTR